MLAKYIAISLFIVVLALITWVSARGGVKDFLFASHDVTWKPLSVSIFSSVLSSYNFVVILTFSFLYGPYVLLIFLGVLVAFIGIYLIAKKHRDIIRSSRFNNIIDFFAERFDSRVATTLNIAFVGALILFIILQLFINTSIFSELLGWGKYVSALFVGAVVFVYTALGGLRTEIYTDVFQGILMLAVGVLVFMVDISAVSASTATSMLSNTEALIATAGLGVAQFLTLLVQPEMWQRVAAAKSFRHLKKAFITSWIFLLIIVVPLIVIGMAAQAGGSIENPSNLLIDTLKTSAPAWYLPFLLASLFAALMSTIDSSLFAVSSQLGKYGLVATDSESNSNDRGGARSNSGVAHRTRVTVGIVVVVTLVASLFFGSFLSGVFKLVSLLTVISTAVVLSFVFDMSSTELFIVLLVGIGVFIGAFIGNYLTEKAVTTLYPSFILIGYALIQTMVVRGYNGRIGFSS